MSFLPRTSFEVTTALPRSYFLGHHQAGLSKMKTLLSQIDLIIECRDYRVPLSSTNPLFESVLSDRPRLIVLTKRDLGFTVSTAATQACEASLAAFFQPNKTLYISNQDQKDKKSILRLIRDRATSLETFSGTRVMVVGMPNVGKSTLLNALRNVGVNKGKAASTGAQPGITRSIGTAVKILDGDRDRAGNGPVYLLDTPGVFVPYVPDAETMLKLCLVGCVKDGLVASETTADYLLYQMNLHDPNIYSAFSQPTNDVHVLLQAVSTKTGLLGAGGTPQIDQAATWLLQRWRQGKLGKFLLDDVSKDALKQRKAVPPPRPVSMNQAKKVAKDAIRARGRAISMMDR